MKKVLTLAANPDHDYFSLFKIFEVIEQAMGGRRRLIALAVNLEVATETDIQRFGDSANNEALTGEAARHAKDFEKPPVGPPMGIKESQRLVYALGIAFMRGRVPDLPEVDRNT